MGTPIVKRAYSFRDMGCYYTPGMLSLVCLVCVSTRNFNINLFLQIRWCGALNLFRMLKGEILFFSSFNLNKMLEKKGRILMGDISDA